MGEERGGRTNHGVFRLRLRNGKRFLSRRCLRLPVLPFDEVLTLPFAAAGSDGPALPRAVLRVRTWKRRRGLRRADGSERADRQLRPAVRPLQPGGGRQAGDAGGTEVRGAANLLQYSARS